MPTLRLSNVLASARYLGAISLAAIAVPGSAQGCPTFAFDSLQLTLQPSTGVQALQPANFALQAGLLQPQLETLLQQQFAVELIDWQVSPHFRWPADYRLQAPSWEELLERLLKPYQLAVTLYPNKSATVRYQTTAKGAL